MAGFLRWKGYQVDIAYFHHNEPFEYVKDNISYDYEFYGLCVDIKNIERCIKLADLIKDRTSATIWFGGAFVASCYRNIFEDCHGVDYIILGGGESPLQFLFEHLGQPELENHPNIATRTSLEDKSFHENRIFDYPPAEDYYIKYPAQRGFYTYCLQTKNNTCTGACNFCINWCLKRNRMEMFYRDTDSIVEEIVHMHNKYDISHFFFIDDDILDPGTREAKQRIAGLCRAIIGKNLRITLTGYTKANNLLACDEDEELLDLMYKAGFVSLFVGIESGCQNDLLLFHKLANVEDNRRSLRLLYKHHIKPEYEMITFHPYATMESLKENFKFLKEVHSYNLRHYAMTGISIYQNTALWYDAVRDGLLLDGYSYKSPDFYKFLNPDVQRMAEFIRTHFENDIEMLKMISADQLVTFFYRFSHYSEKVRGMEESIEQVKKDSFELLQDYFEPLFMDNDLELCEKKYAAFLQEYKRQGEVIQKLVNRMLKYTMIETK